ncbi:hypothetical protein [Nevskia sp.]|uniref:hypothetical protein n=1 Tax=Nevskia sp. TaxID=1929292 RepID=UPI0025FFA1F4|nr:hypothetical protein [Nevskia sp.]
MISLHVRRSRRIVPNQAGPFAFLVGQHCILQDLHAGILQDAGSRLPFDLTNY